MTFGVTCLTLLADLACRELGCIVESGMKLGLRSATGQRMELLCTVDYYELVPNCRLELTGVRNPMYVEEYTLMCMDGHPGIVDLRPRIFVEEELANFVRLTQHAIDLPAVDDFGPADGCT